MCLSNCSQCKYFDRSPHHSGDILCALNPAYTSMWKRLNSLDKSTLNCLPVDNCLDFELDPSFEEKTISLNLSFHDWQRLIRESSNLALTKALRDVSFSVDLSLTLEQWQQIANSTIVPTVRVTLSSFGIEAQRDPWICVDSSCIDAIAYLRNTSILKIRFVSGAVYQYFRVDESTFLDFRDADSFGSFFNQHIKGCYHYQPI